MSAEAWATLAGAAVVLAVAGIGGIVWLVRLEGRVAQHRAAAEGKIQALEQKTAELAAMRDEVIAMRGQVRGLEQKAKEHGDVRDLVIEMRTEMRGVQRSIEDLAKALKEMAQQGRSVHREG